MILISCIYHNQFYLSCSQDRRLSPEKLHTLRLIGLGGERLCQEVLLFLEQANSIALRELHLSYSAMQDEDVTQLLEYVYHVIVISYHDCY